MENHWHAFSFVERITAVTPGRSIQGYFSIPSNLDAFPVALAGEAVGQLAAWAAMAAVDFQTRPIAGIAGRIQFLSDVKPGQKLELVADLESVDLDAATYSGSASVDGKPIIQLEHCVGPMLPVAELDDPVLVRERYALLCTAHGASIRFRGLPRIELERQAAEAEKGARARMTIPAQAPLFDDHFPRRPVFPGSLLMQTSLNFVREWAQELERPSQGGRWQVESVVDMKFRAFVPPGAILDLELRLGEVMSNGATINLDARANGRLVGAARVKLIAAN